MTIGTRGPLGLEPGKSIEISYDLIAPDPSPQTKKSLRHFVLNLVQRDSVLSVAEIVQMHHQSRLFTTEEISLLENKQYL